eukprot:579187_1
MHCVVKMKCSVLWLLISTTYCFEWSQIKQLQYRKTNDTFKCATEPYLEILLRHLDRQYKSIQFDWNEELINKLQQYSIRTWYNTKFGRYDRRLHSVAFNLFDCNWTHSKFPNDFAQRKVSANMNRIVDICQRITGFANYLILNHTNHRYIHLLVHIGDAVFYPLPRFPIFSSSNNNQMNEYIFLLPSRVYYFDSDFHFIARMDALRENETAQWKDKIPKAFFCWLSQLSISAKLRVFVPCTAGVFVIIISTFNRRKV